MRILKSIKAGDRLLSFQTNTNIITGHTGNQKTLFFSLIMYMFGINERLDHNVAMSRLNTNSVSMVAEVDGKEYVFERSLESKNHFKINNETIDKLNNYKDKLNHIFGFKRTNILSGNRNIDFNISEYIKMLFIPEEQLTSQDNIFLKNGYSEATKIYGFFKYMITGQEIEKDIQRKTSQETKNKKRVDEYIRAVNYIYKPKKADIKKRDEIKAKIEEKLDAIKLKNEEINNYTNEINSISLINSKLYVLRETYQNDIEDFNSAELFESIEEIIDSGSISLIDFEYYQDIRNAVSDIDLLLQENTSRVDKLNNELIHIQNLVKHIQEEVENLNEELKEYEAVEKYDLFISSASEMKNTFEKRLEISNQTFKTESAKIETAFSELIKKLCHNVHKRIKDWGIEDVGEIRFDRNTYDFIFGDTPLKLVPKGLKSIYSLAFSTELYLASKQTLINVVDCLVIDSIWVATDLKTCNLFTIKNNIIKNLNLLGVQVLIFENENDEKQIEDCNYITLD